MCILKGIYPREPKHKPNKSTTYYHVKDINYIRNEPIIDYFRQMKAFLKKVSLGCGSMIKLDSSGAWSSRIERGAEKMGEQARAVSGSPGDGALSHLYCNDVSVS